MLKKISLLLILISIFSLTACNKKTEKAEVMNKDVVAQKETGSVKVNLQTSADKYYVNDYVKVGVNINTGESSVNTAQLLLNYDKEMLEYDSVTTAGSQFTVWTKKGGGNGEINLLTAQPNPGIKGDKQHVAVVIFKAIKSGDVKVTVDKMVSKMFTTEGQNMLKSAGHQDAQITILPLEQ